MKKLIALIFIASLVGGHVLAQSLPPCDNAADCQTRINLEQAQMQVLTDQQTYVADQEIYQQTKSAYQQNIERSDIANAQAAITNFNKQNAQINGN